MCVQRFDDSRGIAIRITYRISLRSSSLWEPRHPSLKVVYVIGLCVSWLQCKQVHALQPTDRFRSVLFTLFFSYLYMKYVRVLMECCVCVLCCVVCCVLCVVCLSLSLYHFATCITNGRERGRERIVLCFTYLCCVVVLCLLIAQRMWCTTNFGNDPSAGSPTETLLRLHLPLNDKV